MTRYESGEYIPWQDVTPKLERPAYVYTHRTA